MKLRFCLSMLIIWSSNFEMAIFGEGFVDYRFTIFSNNEQYHSLLLDS